MVQTWEIMCGLNKVKSVEVSTKYHRLRPRRLLSRGGTDQLYPRVTIDKLLDEILLDIFEFYMAFSFPRPSHKEDIWHTLVHVCRRWRYVVFGSPRRLDLKLLCINRRLAKTLDIWPELPIVIHLDDWEFYQPPRVANVISVLLKHHNRVCKIFLGDVPNSFLKEVATTNGLFPALIDFNLASLKEDPPTLPDSFLGGSVPSLRSFTLRGIPFPALGKLLLTTRDLVNLTLGFNPPSEFILPDAMVDILSALTKLKTFDLSFDLDHFESPQFWDHRVNQRPPALPRVILPALTNFNFYGDSKYLEGIVSRIDASLDSIAVTFSHQLKVSDIPLLRDFIGRTKILNRPHRLYTSFSSADVEISLFQQKGDVGFKVLNLSMLCSWYAGGSQLSLLAQICSMFLPPLPSLELLGMFSSKHLLSRLQHEVDNTRWMEILRPFATVKDLVLDERVGFSVAPCLQELVGEQVTEILPALQNIFLQGIRSPGSVPEGIGKFTAVRGLSGRPVVLHHWGTKH
jgi:hypothetical protein